MKRRSSRFSWVLLLLVSAIFAVFFLWPLLESVRGAFTTKDGAFTLAYVRAVFDNPVYVEGFTNSLAVAAVSTSIALVMGLSLSLLTTRIDFPGRAWVPALVPLPLIVPPFVGALGISQLLGRYGSFNALLQSLGLADPSAPTDWLQSGRFAAVVILTALHLYPIVYFNVAASLTHQNPELDRAAELLGARGLRRLFRVTLPLSLPSLFGSLTLVFIWGLTELGVPLVCDYGRVTSVQIFSGLKEISQNPLVYALVTVTLFATVTLYVLSRLFFGRPTNIYAGTKGQARRQLWRPPTWLRILASAAAFAIVIVAALPNVAVVLLAFARDWHQSILPNGFTVSHFEAALSHPLVVPAISNSLRYVVVATFIDLVLGFTIAWVVVRLRAPGSKLLDALAMLPLSVPGLVLAFGYLAITREGRPLAFLDPTLDPTWLLVIAYAMRRLPFVLRSTAAGLTQTSEELEEAAQSLGANPFRVLARVTLPLLSLHLLAGGIFAFALSMLEVSDSLILAQKREFFPITKAIFELTQLLGDGRLLAAALGVWSMLLLGTALYVTRTALTGKGRFE